MDTLDKSPPSSEAYPDTQITEFAPMDTQESSINLNSKSGLREESATEKNNLQRQAKGKEHVNCTFLNTAINMHIIFSGKLSCCVNPLK